MSDFNALAMRCGLGRGVAVAPPTPTPTPPTLSTILNEVDITFNGKTWGSQNAGLVDSFRASSDFSTMVFRTRYGENYAQAGDTSRRVRSEITSSRPGGLYIAAGQTLHASGIVRISGTPHQVEWDSFIQLHDDDQNSGSPSFEVCSTVLNSGIERLVVSMAYRRQSDSSIQYVPDIYGPVFVRDVDHTFDVVFVNAYGGNGGSLVLLWDGAVAATYSGPTGYYLARPNSAYLKFGTHAGVDTDGTFPANWDQTTTLRNVVVTVS